MVETINGVRLTPSHKWVFEIIRRKVCKAHVCTLTNAYISKAVSLSASRVSHIISDLQKAGLLIVRLLYDTVRKNWVLERQIFVAQTLENARNDNHAIGGCAGSDTHKGGEKNKEGEPKEKLSTGCEQTDKKKIFIVKECFRLGINPIKAVMLMRKYSLDYMIDKLAIVAASKSVRSPLALFFASLKHDYKLGEYAKTKRGKKNQNTCKVTTMPPEEVKKHKENPDNDWEHSELIQALIKKNPNGITAKLYKERLEQKKATMKNAREMAAQTV